MNDLKNAVPSAVPTTSKARTGLIFAAVGVFAAIVFGVLYLFVLAPSIPNGSVGWFLFSFATGLTMIVLPCTLPLAFVIVPLSMGKGMVRGIGMALCFGIGIATTLSLYGVAAALLGGIAIDALGADLDAIKNWVYFVAGSFALMFALSEIGLMNIHMPTYKGAAPAFIQKRGEFIKAFLLGLFLGNVGVGCPHPATPLILIEIASSGDVLYGWLMFLVHAIGRVLPLLLLSFLAILGVNGLNWLLARKDAVEKATGWSMVFVAGFILTLGLFSHDWWVNSGLHSGLETLTQEHRFNVLINDTLGTDVEHLHGLEQGTGLFGLPLEYGSLFLVFLWIFPMYWWYRNKKKAVEEGNDECDAKILSVKRNFLILTAIFLILIFTYFLPKNFYLKSIGSDDHHDDSHPMAELMVGIHAMTDGTIVDADGTVLEGAHQMPDGSIMLADGTMIESMMAPLLGTPFSSETAGLPEAVEPETVNLADGDTYDITAGYVQKEVGNRTLRMLAYNGSVPGPFIKAPQGAEVTINFTNNTDIDQTIHSHGLRLDNNFDGVPGVTQDVVAPGGEYTYTIKFEDAGVYWYHPHTRDDYGQEMGLYGNYIVSSEEGYLSAANREVPLVIDDILIENDRIANFYKEVTNFALLGRFGNEYLVNGEKNYTLTAQKGEVVRFLVTNVSNARTYNLSIPGADLKLVAADVGQFENEQFVGNFLISPAERMVVETYFEKAGTYQVLHTTPTGEIELVRILVSDSEVENSYADSFNEAKTNEAVTAEFANFRSYVDVAPDKNLLLTIALEQEMDHGEHAHGVATEEVDHSAHAHSADATDRLDSIQWDDPTQSDVTNTTESIVWRMVDQDTGKENMTIDDWTFTQGDLVKVRITNDAEADHVMQHPIHLHGQRFVVLTENGEINQNMAWKDTVLVFPGETIDVLVDMSNLGEWMSHCHISEHLHAGMMMQFRVQDSEGYATGDEYRSTAPVVEHTMPVVKEEMAQKMSTREFMFDTPVAVSPYSVTVSNTRFTTNTKNDVTLAFFDAENNGIKLSSDHKNPLGVTFVNSDGHQKVYSYPGNIEFDNLDHDTSGHDDSDGHHDAPAHDDTDGHHGFNLIPTAHAHGGVEDGHPNATGRTYEYTVPVAFAEKGFYRAFVEFVPEGEAEVSIATFDLEVASSDFSIDNMGWTPEFKWWVLLIASLLLIVPLVIGVRKYINVDKK